jgi:four helix bundle protein
MLGIFVAPFSRFPKVKRKPEHFIPPHGGYENLLSFQKARIVYDGTVWFCERFLQRRDRTYDQMAQAARSGKQNILEGSRASGTSKETEIKLTNVARASLEELLEDYRDFIRLRGIEEWPKHHSHTRRLRLDHFYWQASHSAPLRMASIEQASCSSAVNSRLPPAMPLTSFFTETVDFSMFEAWSVRR